MAIEFDKKRAVSSTGKHILKQRYFQKDETTWEQVVDRVTDWVMGTSKNKEEFRQMLLNTYFVPNSPALVNSGKEGGGLSACFVVDFKDTIEDIIETKGNFFHIARKGGGCGTTLSKIRPEGDAVGGSSHKYAGGPIKFADTISYDMDAITQGGFRAMAIMFTMSVYHPDIMKFITAKHEEGRIHNANISVVVDNAFMEKVVNEEKYWTEFNGVKYHEYSAKDIFDMIIEGAWKNGEPGMLFREAINDSPYKYTKQEIMATNPCLSGDTLVQTVDGQIAIKDLVGKTIDVYCMSDDGVLEIGKAFNIRKTRENAIVIRVQTSRGHIVCTPDHLFFTKNRGYVEARNLTKKDLIVGLNKKMHGERYCSISLTGNKKYEKEHRFIMRHYEDISGKDVHHSDGNSLNNAKSNLEVLDHNYHSSITNLNHYDYGEHDGLGRFVKKIILKKKKQLQLDDGNPKGLNLCVLGIEYVNQTEDVYDLEVETFHNFIANGVVVHNCGEQPLPPSGSCNLGALDLSKFIKKDLHMDWEKLERAVELAVEFLDNVITVSTFPTDEMHHWAHENRPIGLGIMGFADMLLMKEIAYGSDESLNLLGRILDHIYKVAEKTSIKFADIRGIPFQCEFLPVPRRNITLTTIAPTGTTSLIAGCSSGIEPIFSEITVRNDKTGTYTFVNDLAEKDYFRCAVSSNGAHEVTWEEHVAILAEAQKHVDSGVSKTVNFPTMTHRETIGKAFVRAWKSGCKGLAVYRNGSRKVEVLSPKNIARDKCPLCDTEIIEVANKKKCPSCEWREK